MNTKEEQTDEPTSVYELIWRLHQQVVENQENEDSSGAEQRLAELKERLKQAEEDEQEEETESTPEEESKEQENDNKVRCDDCKQWFKNQNGLNVHRAHIHGEDNDGRTERINQLRQDIVEYLEEENRWRTTRELQENVYGEAYESDTTEYQRMIRTLNNLHEGGEINKMVQGVAAKWAVKNGESPENRELIDRVKDKVGERKFRILKNKLFGEDGMIDSEGVNKITFPDFREKVGSINDEAVESVWEEFASSSGLRKALAADAGYEIGWKLETYGNSKEPTTSWTLVADVKKVPQ